MATLRPGKAEMAKLREANGLLMGSRERYDALAEADAVGLLMECDDLLEETVRGAAKKGRPMLVKDMVYQAFVGRMVRRDLVGAAAVLWAEDFFNAEPWAVGKTWAAMDESAYVSVLGAGSVGKSFNVAARYFMEWAADPQSTMVDLVSKNQEKIKKLFADFVAMHRRACIVLPGAVEAETISVDKIGRWGIFMNLIKAGEASSSVLKGTHEKSRAKAHPIYGRRTARFVMIDEAQDVNEAVFDDLGNIMLSMRGGGEGVCGGRMMRQITLTANPALPNSRYGEQNKPEGGWTALGDDAEDWIAKSGARCVRIDALKTENVREKRVVFNNPGLVTWEGVQNQLAMCDGNDNHPLWWTYVRGFFPPEGAMSTLIPQRWLSAAEGEWIFETEAREHCGVDVARLGGDSPAMAFGRVGRAVAWRDYSGHEYRMTEPGWRVQLDAVVRLAPGDTQEVANDVMRRLRDTRTKPEHVAVDATGSAGVFDLLVHQWRDKGLAASAVNTALGESPEWTRWVEADSPTSVSGVGSPVIGINSSRRPSELKVGIEDSGTPRELYVNTATELCYALARFFEMGYIRYGRGVNQRTTLNEISTRKGGLVQGKGRRMAVESKEAHKKRLPGSASPDEMDAVALFLASVRFGTPELQPKARGTVAQVEDSPGRPSLRDGATFPMRDESDFAPANIDEIVASQFGDEKGGHGRNEMAQMAGADADPRAW